MMSVFTMNVEMKFKHLISILDKLYIAPFQYSALSDYQSDDNDLMLIRKLLNPNPNPKIHYQIVVRHNTSPHLDGIHSAGQRILKQCCIG